jgi:hypothetical protein
LRVYVIFVPSTSLLRRGNVTPQKLSRLTLTTVAYSAPVVRLGARLASGVVLGEITDPGHDVPTTATVAAGRLWVVDARFTTPPTPATEYWITQLPLRPESG